MPTAQTPRAAAPGKYLTFSLAREHYGLEILRVQEIVGLLPVTRVPRLPDFVAGVVNLRGRVIPVVDLRRAFGLEGRAENADRTCIVVVTVARGAGGLAVMGLLVDEVSDVADLAEESIEATPEFGTGVDTSFIKGVGRAEGKVLLLLDIDRVLSGRDFATVESAGQAVAAGSNVEKE